MVGEEKSVDVGGGGVTNQFGSAAKVGQRHGGSVLLSVPVFSPSWSRDRVKVRADSLSHTADIFGATRSAAAVVHSCFFF